MVSKHILESSNDNLLRPKKQSIQKGLQDRGKTSISWELWLDSVLGKEINHNM